MSSLTRAARPPAPHVHRMQSRAAQGAGSTAGAGASRFAAWNCNGRHQGGAAPSIPLFSVTAEEGQPLQAPRICRPTERDLKGQSMLTSQWAIVRSVAEQQMPDNHSVHMTGQDWLLAKYRRRTRTRGDEEAFLIPPARTHLNTRLTSQCSSCCRGACSSETVWKSAARNRINSDHQAKWDGIGGWWGAGWGACALVQGCGPGRWGWGAPEAGGGRSPPQRPGTRCPRRPPAPPAGSASPAAP